MSENRRILSVVVAIALIFAAAGAAADEVQPPQPAFAGGAVPLDAQAIVRAMNSARAASGMRTFRVGTALRRAARSHSQDMARRNYFDHGPFVQRLRRFGVHSWMLGENIASGSGLSAAEVVQMWLESPEHRDVMLDPRFRRVGVGVAGGGTRLITADFSSG